MSNKKNKTKISIIIKALNEEQNIERAIKSSMSAIKKTPGIKGEIILADSLSTDKTVQIAKKYPIKIVQLENPEDRSCGIGPQLGFQHSEGEYIYILDGDMEIEENFLENAIKELEKEKKLAGIAGQVKEMRAENIVFKRRQRGGRKKIGYTNKLEMGGLYKRKSIGEAGYFSNRNLHAYEEAELGLRLISKGWKLKRIDIPGIKHYGYTTNTLGVFKKRWKTRYVKGSGDFLRSSIGKSYFIKAAWQLKIYLVLAIWWLLLIASLATTHTHPVFFRTFGVITIIILVLFLIKKKNIKEFSFSIISWHYSTIGLIWGLFSTQKNPKEKIESKVINE